MDMTGVSIAIVTVASALGAAYASRFVSTKNRTPRCIKGGALVGDSLKIVRVAFKEGDMSNAEDRVSYKGRESYERDFDTNVTPIRAYHNDQFPHNDIYINRIMYPIDLRPDGTVVFLRSIVDSGVITSWALDAVPLKYFHDPRRRKLVHQIIPILDREFQMSPETKDASELGVAEVGINQVDGFIYVVSGDQMLTIPYEFSSTEKLPSRIDNAFVTEKYSVVEVYPGQVTWLFKEGGQTEDSFLHVYIEKNRMMHGYSKHGETMKIGGYNSFSFETEYGEDYYLSWVDQERVRRCIMILETGGKMCIWDKYGYLWVDTKMLATNEDELSEQPMVSEHIRYVIQGNLDDAGKKTVDQDDDDGLSMYAVPLTRPSARTRRR